jgi:hypothetical protein
MNSNPIPTKRPCAYQHPQTGRACRAWAVRGSNPPRCRAHRRTDRPYDLNEVASLINQANERPLDAEIANVRAAVRQAMTHLHDELPTDEFTHIVRLIFTGSTTIANLLRAQRALGGAAADGLAGAISQVLEEIATEWGIEP